MKPSCSPPGIDSVAGVYLACNTFSRKFADGEIHAVRTEFVEPGLTEGGWEQRCHVGGVCPTRGAPETTATFLEFHRGEVSRQFPLTSTFPVWYGENEI